MNFIALILLVAASQFHQQLVKAHLRSIYPDSESDEDTSEKRNFRKFPPLPLALPDHEDLHEGIWLRPSSKTSAERAAIKESASTTDSTTQITLTTHAYNLIRLALNSSEKYQNNNANHEDGYLFENEANRSSGSSAHGYQLEAANYTELERNITDKPAVPYCLPEVFEHDYIIVENHTQPNINIWKRARASERASLKEVCLMPNGLPLTRLCRYNPQLGSAEWEDISAWPRITCLRQTRECILSDKLNKMHERLLEGQLLQVSAAERSRVTSELYTMLREKNFKLLPADVHLASQILHEVAITAQDPEVSPDIVRICDRLMSSDEHVLRISANLNATNSILDTFEQYMDALSRRQVPAESCTKTQTITIVSRPSEESEAEADIASSYSKAVEEVRMGHLGVRAHISTNISVFFINPMCANISGIALYASMAQTNAPSNAPHALINSAVANFRYRFIFMNESVRALIEESDLQVAGFLPTLHWEYVRSRMLQRGTMPVIVLKVYGHDALFVDPKLEQTAKPFSKILSISLPGFKEKFPEPLTFLLRNRFDYMDASLVAQPGTGCGYWNYSTWVNSGINTDIKDLLTQSVIQCRTEHLTQFSFLLGGSYKQVDISGDVLITPIHVRALDIISIIGCSLSLMGLLCIWVTAGLFKSWRILASTKILLNLCVALTLQMVLFVFVNTEDMSAELVEDSLYVDCVILGAFMQYSILVLFMWMLIIAVLQFQRYVTVIGIERPKRYILKSAVTAWGLPLIPTLLVACINPRSYIPSEYELQTSSGICYPSGLGLALGVIVPITSIVIANLTIFIYVFYSISHTLNQAMHRSEKKMIIKQIRLSVLLFFLLGISWIFGLFAYMQAGVFFSYLFCLTATLQGFVLFIYFVILDEVPRSAWLNLLHSQRKKKRSKRSTELQSITASTGLETGRGESQRNENAPPAHSATCA